VVGALATEGAHAVDDAVDRGCLPAVRSLAGINLGMDRIYKNLNVDRLYVLRRSTLNDGLPLSQMGTHQEMFPA